jgi:AraC-like DNA-binding protein
MLVSRAPAPALRPFVRTVWVSQDDVSSRATREHVLPNGETHVVFRLSDTPLRLFASAADRAGRVVGHCIVGGPRSSFTVRDVSQPVSSVGAQLHAGAASLVLGVSADEIAERHTRLDEIWGSIVFEMRERIALAGPPDRQLALFESLLAARLPRVRALHPAVAEALARFDPAADVRALVARSGYSHRRFAELFRRAVGLAPKRFARVRRFQRALEQAAAQAEPSWADLALGAGYSDQSHFNREFREFAGVTPGRYRQLAPISAHHVPVRG